MSYADLILPIFAIATVVCVGLAAITYAAVLVAWASLRRACASADDPLDPPPADDTMAIVEAVDPLAAYARDMADIAPRFAKLDRNGRTGTR